MSATSLSVPAVLNAATARAFSAALDRAAEGSARVLLLRGDAGVFCRGLDFASLGSGAEDATAGTAEFVACLRSLRLAATPTVAVVEGVALGGGVGLAAACDLVIASNGATFGLPEVLFGLMPAAVMPFLLERMSAQKARLLSLTGRSITADEARELGLVDVVAEPERLERTVNGWVRDLQRARPDAAAGVKRWAADAAALPWPEALDRGAELTAAALRDPELTARVRRFVTGEALPWETE